MKRFLMLTSVLTLAAAPALAQDMDENPYDPETTQETTDVWADADAEIEAEIEVDESFTDDHAWIGAPVFGAYGEDLGEVERVRLDASGEIDAIVVETGGALDIGGREVLIEAREADFAETDGEMRVTLNISAAAFSARPDFDENLATDYPLADDDLFTDDSDEPEEETDDSPSF